MNSQSGNAGRFRCADAALGLIAAITLAGCAAPGGVAITDLNFKRIPLENPLTVEIPADGCSWSLEEDGRLLLGLERDRPGVLNELGRKRLDLSFILGSVPAGRARDYPLDTQSMRCYVREGANHARYRSLRGILGLTQEPGEVLRGRFRLIATKEIFHVLTGWSDAGSAVITGQFRARRNRQAVSGIVARSEEDGMARSSEAGSTAQPLPRPVRVTGPPVDEPPPTSEEPDRP